jgi:hypothetical protein
MIRAMSPLVVLLTPYSVAAWSACAVPELVQST